MVKKSPRFSEASIETLRKLALDPSSPLRRPEVIAKRKMRLKDPDIKKKHAIAVKIGMSKPEVKAKFLGKNNPVFRHEDTIQKIREFRILSTHDIWYGGVTYDDGRKNYCEKWNDDLRERIRAFWGYRSPLSQRTAKDCKGVLLCCHHVYYQKRACCYWDEDTNGYFTMVDGTKHYIIGNPNKFVPLTRSEHSKTSHNKLWWMKFFETMIEEDYNGKSYFTKEEYEKYKIRTVASS